MALEKNDTWMRSSMGKEAISCKWVFTVKHKVDGSIKRFKSRLVAWGFT